MKMPSFAPAYHCGSGWRSSDSIVGSYFAGACANDNAPSERAAAARTADVLRIMRGLSEDHTNDKLSEPWEVWMIAKEGGVRRLLASAGIARLAFSFPQQNQRRLHRIVQPPPVPRRKQIIPLPYGRLRKPKRAPLRLTLQQL